MFDAHRRLFNPRPRIEVMAVPPDQTCIVVDDVLIDPAAVVDWATEREWLPAQANAYPGQLVAAPAELEQCLN